MKVAVVTGASKGIGREIAISLANDGYTVVINYANDETGAQDCLNAINNNGMIYKADVSNYAQCQEMINDVISKYGQIDVLVNNAGITRDNLILRMSEDDFDKVIDTNLKSAFNLCKLVARPMMKNKGGRIINISSVVGKMGNAGQVNYAASKAGIIGLTKSIAKELASKNVLANAVLPGFIATDMTGKMTEDQKNAILSQIPLGKMGSPKDIANMVSFLASDKASYITGQTFIVDGGMCI